MDRPDKRQAILDAALAEFVKRGYHGTTVPSVAATAGVGAGTIYRYFDSKEALANTLYQEWKGRLGAMILDEFPWDGALRAQFRTWYERQMHFIVEHPEASVYMELHHHADYLDETCLALEEQHVAIAAELIARGQAEQVLREGPPVLLAALLYGAIVGLSRASWEGRLELTVDVLESAEQACWELIRA
jgi:TetR/AcrR family transcriptional regulator, repressor of fatR-cypB operon